LEKKINELTTVKHWLNANVGMIDLTIKTLEYQKTIMSSVADVTKKTDAKTKDTDAQHNNPMMNPALWPWTMMQGVNGQPSDNPTSKTDKTKK
jgi:tRNA U34 5-methylaminomethyl-2-thiouridine-forming methyltransferase MnmC